MSILSSKLTASSGLGGAPSGGAYSTSTYGMGSMMASAYSTGAGMVTTGGGALRDINGSAGITAGHVSLGVLELLVIAVVAFYIWTHAVQGGG